MSCVRLRRTAVSPRRRLAFWPALALLAVAGCHQGSPPPGDPVARSTPGFRDVRAASGIDFTMRFLRYEQGERFKINLYDHGCGLAVLDYDGDGKEDLYFLNQLGRNALYRNRGDGTFEDVTEKAGVGVGDRVCVGAVAADYDNDGHEDLYVTSTRGGNLLFHNQGDGTFKDVTKEAGVGHVGHSQTAVFFDANSDGLLDLFVTNSARWTTDQYDPESHYYAGKAVFTNVAQSPREYNLLFLNQGHGKFKDATSQAGLKGLGWGGDVAVWDYDEDGKQDLLVTNMFGRSQLYRNLGGARFEDVTRQTLGKTSWGAIGAKAFDYNNDGRLDLFMSDMHSDMWMQPTIDPKLIQENVKYRAVAGRRVELDPVAVEEEKDSARLLGVHYDQVLFGNTLFRSEGKGKFRETSGEAGMETFWPWGIATGDLDNDGDVDVFLPSGMGHPYFYWRSYLMMNQGNGAFVDRSGAEGIDPPPGGINLPDPIGGRPAVRSARCAVVADFDGDGRLDLVTNNFNDHPYYFRNQFPSRHFIRFQLQGKRSNRDAIGAVLRLSSGQKIQVRQVEAAGGYLSSPSKIVHFGLGENAPVDRVEIIWPSGLRQTLEHPNIDQTHRIEEPGS